MRTKEERKKERARDRRLAKGFGKFLGTPKDKKAHRKKKFPKAKHGETDRPRRAPVHQWKDKRIAKEIRATLKKLAEMPKPPKNPYVALMEPMVIVPEQADGKPVIADAGSVVKLADQANFYRDRVSPVTHRADEILVYYGKAKTPSLGWLTNMQPSKILKPSSGPTFLVTTRAEDRLIAWEQLRLRMARTRAKDPTNWIAPWLAHHGAKYPRELREVTRFFGGKPIKNESTDVRIERLFTLILHTELDMASAKKHKSKSSKKSSKHVSEKSSKKSTKLVKSTKKSSPDRITSAHDDYVIRRLVKENPRRAGSEKAKIWDKLKKGMTVGTFVEKGGSRASVGRYVQNGWVKLLKPAKGGDE